MRILILNGPNLNLLGSREPEVYGSTTLEDIEARLQADFPGVDLEFDQSNIEGELVDLLQMANSDGLDGIVFNPGGYSHTSVALRDAISAISVPVIEVHISNVHAREEFRQNLLLSPVCTGVIAGLGTDGYRLAVASFVERGADGLIPRKIKFQKMVFPNGRLSAELLLSHLAFLPVGFWGW